MLVSGVAFGTIDLGGGAVVTAGGGDVFVASYGIDGSFKWQKVIGDASAQSSGGVTLGPAGSPLIIGSIAGAGGFGGGALPSGGGKFLGRFVFIDREDETRANEVTGAAASAARRQFWIALAAIIE